MTDTTTEVNKETLTKLKDIIKSIETSSAQIKLINASIKETYSYAKSAGFNVKAIKALIKRRKLPENQKHEIETVTEISDHYEEKISSTETL